MKCRKYIFLFIISMMSLLNSCYPPKVIYKLGNIYYSPEDSLSFELVKCYAHASGGTKYYIPIELKVTNTSVSDVAIINYRLSSSTNNNYNDYSSDSIKSILIKSNENKKINMYFHAVDTALLSYCFDKENSKKHELLLDLDIKSKEQEKNISLSIKPSKCTR